MGLPSVNVLHYPLSIDHDIEQELKKLQSYIEAGGKDWRSQIQPISSVTFAMEMAERLFFKKKPISFFLDLY